MSKVHVYVQQLRPTSPSRAYCEECKPELVPYGHNSQAVITDKELSSAFGIEDMCKHLVARQFVGVIPAPDAPK